jgi:hypothetical protein
MEDDRHLREQFHDRQDLGAQPRSVGDRDRASDAIDSDRTAGRDGELRLGVPEVDIERDQWVLTVPFERADCSLGGIEEVAVEAGLRRVTDLLWRGRSVGGRSCPRPLADTRARWANW